MYSIYITSRLPVPATPGSHCCSSSFFLRSVGSGIGTGVAADYSRRHRPPKVGLLFSSPDSVGGRLIIDSTGAGCMYTFCIASGLPVPTSPPPVIVLAVTPLVRGGSNVKAVSLPLGQFQTGKKKKLVGRRGYGRFSTHAGPPRRQSGGVPPAISVLLLVVFQGEGPAPFLA